MRRDDSRRVLLALACLMHCAVGAGVFELQILEFSNYRAELSRGACCGGAARPANNLCTAPCRTRFDLCLKEYQSTAAPGACSFGRATSPVLGSGSFTLVEPLYTLALPFSFRWTRSFTLNLQAYDDYNYTDPEGGLIVGAWWSGIVEPGAAWHALRHAGEAAAVAYRVRVLCAPNYYNTTCTTFCRPRTDKFGHYTCSPDGAKHCLPGWQGDNCEKPVCKEGCHPTHGRCDRPGECDCRPGWRGELCSQCQPYPGCKHGYCNGSSWDCTCDTNWGGILCDQDLNYCGTHEPCQHGGTCENTAPDQYLCTCAEGFSGTDCERVDNPCAPQPCAHGACALAPAAPAASPSPPAPSAPGYTCTCERGWGGALCDTDLDDCASAPCQHGAICRDQLDAFACECTPGWTGPMCAEDVNECAASGETESSALGPCVNAASCANTPGGYSCTCLAGWTGRDCETNVDDCTGQCLNGATCIDLVDDFHCACAAGYSGRTCARDVDDCAPRPCRNGGECVDLLDAYRCICPVGFSGTDCELASCFGRYCPDDRDHCAGNPCANGAPCYTAQSDYYCHCSPGWTGKNCTQRTTRDRSQTGVALSEECGACGAGGACSERRCVCRAGWTGVTCDIQIDECAMNPCRNNATCVDGVNDFTCICPEEWTGKTCSLRSEGAGCEEGSCANGGTCVRSDGAWRCACLSGWRGAACDVCACGARGDCAPGGGCACRDGWGGARCERAPDACGSAPCRHGRCAGGAGWWRCECAPGWAGADCSQPVCEPPCEAPALCEPDVLGVPRCVCPQTSATSSRRCLELIAGFGVERESEPTWEAGAHEGASCGADNATWWWGCNACWCGAGQRVCTRLWCGLPDCLAPGALACRSDEVCVPAAPALCLRGPCAALGECRRVAGRRVEPPALPAPPNCWPIPTNNYENPTVTSTSCARVRLQLARERLGAGAHVERACGALRRALAAALAASRRAAPDLVLLCDLAPDDDDALDIALWAGDEEASESTLAAGVRALSELVSRRRLAGHALLGAALRLRASSPPPATTSPAGPGVAALVAGVVAPVLLVLAGVAALVLHRRRAAAAERSRHDEEKSNNLQNEENLRRYANPLRDGDAELPRAHSLYKAQNADARNHTPPQDKELTTKRALPPPHPPERLTVLV